MSDIALTTKEAAMRLGIKQVTARSWCENGKFPNAFKESSPRGDYWLIPEKDVLAIDPETIKVGRPMTDTPTDHAIAKRKQRAKQKEKAV